MIFWKGRGLLIALSAIAGFAVGAALDSMIVAFWAAAAAVWVFALTFGKTTSQVLLDPQTQREVVFKNVHTLYFLPPKFWAVALTALALFMTFVPSERHGNAANPAAEAQFKAANDLISSNKNGLVAHGNTKEALAVATSFSTTVKQLRDVAIEPGKKSAFSSSGGEFLTYVHLTPERCIFLVHVPQLRKFTKEAKEAIAQIAWMNAQAEISRITPRPALLALGIRGAALYDRAYIGHVVPDSDETNTGIDRTVDGNSSREELATLFAPEPAPVEKTTAAPAKEPAPAPASPETKAADAAPQPATGGLAPAPAPASQGTPGAP